MERTKMKIVADSASDLVAMEGVDFACVPLRIITADREFVDTDALNVEEMAGYLLTYKGKSTTACPNVNDWLEAFGDGQYVFCVAITSNLSGSCNAAMQAKKEYEEKYPDRRVHVVDSLSAGPEERLLAEKLRELIQAELSFEEICNAITEYQKRTRLLFMLESMKNLANNGRVSPLVARAAGLLGIRLVGKASDQGTLEPLEKCRGEKKALHAIFSRMKALGYEGGKVIISHCRNLNAAEQLREFIHREFAAAKVVIDRCRGLCSFYAEMGGMLLGFEAAGR